MKLRCYCCGESLDVSRVALVTMQYGEVDRVFVFKPDHVERVDDEAPHELVDRVDFSKAPQS